MIAAPILCRWCGRACQPRRGGSPKMFCTSGCRTAFHTAARRWAEQAVTSGMLTIADLRNGGAAACTLLTDGISNGQVSEPQLPAAVAPAARPGEVIVSLALDHMTAMQVRELTWGDPFHPTTAANLATASGALLKRAIRALLTAPRAE